MSNRFTAPAVTGAIAVLLCAAGVLYILSVVQQQVEQSVRRNFLAAGVLSHVQLQGERLRRYEKEMFIYVAEPAKRLEYVKEFDTAAREMLTELDSALLPSSRSFDDAERQQIARWKAAALFYIGEFERLAERAQQLDMPGRAPSELVTTIDFNKAIGPGKDRFRELLKGAQTMRVAKEQASMQIATRMDRQFFALLTGTIVLAVLGLLVVLAWPRVARGSRRFLLGPAPAAAAATPTR